MPAKVNAQAWLKGKADPDSAVEWQPHEIFMSCDGSIGVSKGAWQSANGSTGHFTTIWRQEKFGQRKSKKDRSWKWLFDEAVPLDKPLEEPDFIETEVASCKGKPSPVAQNSIDNISVSGGSADGSLTWQVLVNADKSRAVSVSLWDGETWKKVHSYTAAAE